MASPWIPIDKALHRVLEDVPGEEFSNESEDELSVHKDSESEDQDSVDNQDFSDSGESDFDHHGNGMFFICLHGLATVYTPILSSQIQKSDVYSCALSFCDSFMELQCKTLCLFVSR